MTRHATTAARVSTPFLARFRRTPRATHTNRSHATHGSTTRAPAHHQRKPGMASKITGMLMRLKGSLTGRSGVKGSGTKRMRGTDGRGSRGTAGTRRSGF